MGQQSGGTVVSGCYSHKVQGGMGFPGGPVVKTLHFHCRGRGFDPWSGN